MKLYFLSAIALGCLVSGEIDKEHVHSNNEFTIDLLNALTHQNRTNIVFSSLSIEILLELTYLGARGDAAAEIKKVLQLPESTDKIKSMLQSLFTEVSAIKGPELILANKIFLAKGLPIEKEFTKTAKEVFHAEVGNVDFSKNVEATQEINSWVEKETHDKIKNIVNEDQISELTRMVLVNTLYFKGLFEHPFNPEDTEKQDFILADNKTVKVDTMELTQHLPVYHSEEHKLTAISLPYAYSNGRLKLVLGLPHEEIDDYLSKAKKMAPEQRGKHVKKHCKIYLPKFRIESSIDVKPILKDLGIKRIFSSPDLGGITAEQVEVSAMNQKVFIDVNEAGTEAAASTAAIGSARSLPMGAPVEYRFNRPFLFTLMYDEITLLTGRVMNPLER